MLCQFLPYSKVNQLYICIFFFIFFPHIGYYRYCVAFPVLYSRFSLVTYFIYAVLCLIAQLYLTLCNSMDYSPPGSSVHGILQARILGWGLPWPPPVDLPNPGIKPRSSAWQADSLPSESPGKSKNTGRGSLSLLQGNFPTRSQMGFSCFAGGFFTS